MAAFKASSTDITGIDIRLLGFLIAAHPIMLGWHVDSTAWRAMILPSVVRQIVVTGLWARKGLTMVTTRSGHDALTRTIASLQRRANILLEIQEILRSDPQFAEELRAALGQVAKHPPAIANGDLKGSQATVTGSIYGGERTHAESVLCAMEKAQGDGWMTVPEIAAKADLERSAVNYVLYRSHAKRFDKRDHPTHGKLKLWRLKKGGGGGEES